MMPVLIFRSTSHGDRVYKEATKWSVYGDAMTEELDKLIEAARTRPVSEAEREAQRRSFAYGNAKIENPRVTWEMIVEADEQIKAELAAAQ